MNKLATVHRYAFVLFTFWLTAANACAQPGIPAYHSIEARIAEAQFVAFGSITDLTVNVLLEPGAVDEQGYVNERGECEYTLRTNFKTILKKVDGAGDQGEFKTFTTQDKAAGKSPNLERWARDGTMGLWLIQKKQPREEFHCWEFFPFDEPGINHFGYSWESIAPPVYRSDLTLMTTQQAIRERIIQYAPISQKQHQAWLELPAGKITRPFHFPAEMIDDETKQNPYGFQVWLPVDSDLPGTGKKLIESPGEFLPKNALVKDKDARHLLVAAGIEMVRDTQTEANIELLKKCLDESAFPFSHSSNPLYIRTLAMQKLLDLEVEIPLPAFSNEVEQMFLSREKVSDETFEFVAKLPNLKELNLWQSEFSAAGIAHLGKLKNLQELGLKDQYITNEVLKALQSNDQLHVLSNASTSNHVEPKSADEVTELNFNYAFFDDEGMKILTQFKNLTLIDLSKVKITDAAIEDLLSFKKLKYLTFYGTEISNQGIKKLRKGLPKCKIRIR